MHEAKGQVALVTGASRGIGAHIARALAGAGVHVALVARSLEPLRELAAQLTGPDMRAVAIAADLARTDELGDVLDRAQAELGPIDLLVNNAGVEGIRSFVAESDRDTESLVRLNLLVPMLLSHAAVSRMLPRGRGHVINIASLAGKNTAPYATSYGAAKAGLIAFTHNLRAELRGSGVSASVVCPGFVADVGMFADRAGRRRLRAPRVLGTTTAEEVARAVLAAWRKDEAERLVNPGAMRVVHALNQIAPSLVLWGQERLGVNRMLRRMALGDGD